MAVAGAVGAQRLPISKGVFAISVAFAACGIGVVDAGAEEHFGVGLAGQKAWHVCAGEAAPRLSGKYLPSQLRTQKAGPELATTSRGGGGCGLLFETFGEKRGLVLLLLPAA